MARPAKSRISRVGGVAAASAMRAKAAMAPSSVRRLKGKTCGARVLTNPHQLGGDGFGGLEEGVHVGEPGAVVEDGGAHDGAAADAGGRGRRQAPLLQAHDELAVPLPRRVAL